MAQLHRNSLRVVEAARSLGVEIAVTTFPEGTRTAADAAAAIGCEVGAIVKSIVLVSDQGPLVALVSGVNRADESRVAAVLGCGAVRRATPDEAREATGFPIGGTAPFGHPGPVPVVMDRDLERYEHVWAAAGTPQTVFPITPGDLARASGANVADIAVR